MIEIRSSQFNSQHLEILHKWFVEEWGEVDTFSECKNGISLLAPILALNDDILGGSTAPISPQLQGHGQAGTKLG